MPDAFARVRPGDGVRFSATLWNSMIDAAAAEKKRQAGGGPGPHAQGRNPALVKVKNETGADLDRGNVVGLGSPIVLPSDDEDTFLREVTFRVAVPALPTHWGRFAVLLEPAPQNLVVRAYAAGVCPVKVDVLGPDDRHADVADGHYDYLASAGDGAAQILWREGDESGGPATGLQWALVRVGNRGRRCLALSTSVITKRSGSTLGSGTATLQWVSASGVLTATTQNQTVYNLSVEKSVASGAYFQYKTDSGQLLVDWADCGALGA